MLHDLVVFKDDGHCECNIQMCQAAERSCWGITQAQKAYVDCWLQHPRQRWVLKIEGDSTVLVHMTRHSPAAGLRPQILYALLAAARLPAQLILSLQLAGTREGRDKLSSSLRCWSFLALRWLVSTWSAVGLKACIWHLRRALICCCYCCYCFSCLWRRHASNTSMFQASLCVSVTMPGLMMCFCSMPVISPCCMLFHSSWRWCLGCC